MTNGKVLGGFAEEENRNILSPQQVRSKGHPLCKRKTSKIEKICQNKKEKNGKKKLDYRQTMKVKLKYESTLYIITLLF